MDLCSTCSLSFACCTHASHTVVDCGPLANPKFGSVTLRGTTFGSTATYSCIKGYFLVGVTTRNCQATGDWSGQAPICQGESQGWYIMNAFLLQHRHMIGIYSVLILLSSSQQLSSPEEPKVWQGCSFWAVPWLDRHLCVLQRLPAGGQCSPQLPA